MDKVPLVNTTETIPLTKTPEGVVRVGQTRVTLDTVVGAFNDGASAEEIVSQYPTLDLADVYAVISYYLRHRAEVEEYLRQREQKAAEVRAMNEARFPPDGLRARLLARQAQKQKEAMTDAALASR